MKSRNPRAEFRKKAEFRRPNFEDRMRPEYAERRRFGFRVSDFLRPSDFGFRISTAAFLVSAANCLFASTNLASPEEIPALAPPHAEIPPSFWEQYGFWVVAGAVVLLAGVGAAVWFLRRPKPQVPLPPEVQARQALEPLRQQPEDGALLSQVSQALRRYVTVVFDLPPEELTTAEFCRVISGHDQIGSGLSVSMSEFLRQCDQRKFAPSGPLPPLGAVSHALELIQKAEALRSQLRQAEVPAGGAESTHHSLSP